MTAWARIGGMIVTSINPASWAAAGRRMRFGEPIPPDRPDPEVEFWKLYRLGWSPKSLARRYGMSAGQVRKVVEKKVGFPR